LYKGPCEHILALRMQHHMGRSTHGVRSQPFLVAD
jgi:hypothetical protein